MSSDKNRNTKRILSALLGMTATFNGSFASACKRAYINKSDKYESVKNKTENMPSKTEQDEESLENSKTSSSVLSRHPVLTTFGILLVASVAGVLIYNRVNSDAAPSIDLNILRDMSSDVPGELHYLKLAIDEKLKDLEASNKKNIYSLFRTGLRRIIAGFENKTAIERAFESNELYAREQRNVTCWDASLAFLYNIYSEYGPYGRQPVHFANMKVGLMSYDIPITFGLANHTFCYVIVDNILFMIDPLLGASICINLGNDRDIITEQISVFYSVQKNANVMPGIGSLYKLFNSGVSKFKNLFVSNNVRSPYGKDGVFVSDNMFKSNNAKLSDVKWMPDTEFLGNLLAGRRDLSSADFVWRAPGALFG